MALMFIKDITKDASEDTAKDNLSGVTYKCKFDNKPDVILFMDIVFYSSFVTPNEKPESVVNRLNDHLPQYSNILDDGKILQKIEMLSGGKTIFSTNRRNEIEIRDQ